MIRENSTTNWTDTTPASSCWWRYDFDTEKCPNCRRKMPNTEFRRKYGCKWCVPKHPTEFCNGKY